MDSGGVPAHTAPIMVSAVNLRVLRGAAFGLALAAVAPAAAQEQDAARFDNLVRSSSVHCAFYRDYDIDPNTGDRLLVEGRSNSLTHFQRRGAGPVRSIDTRRAGAVDVQVVRRRYLHYIERTAGMFIVTTVYACLARDPLTDVCINYGAVNARHFDGRVLLDPDRVYEQLQAQAEPGFCDHSFIHQQEATNRPLRQ